MHRSLRDNGLFRSSSNYRVDNEGFDSKKPRCCARSLSFLSDGAASPFRVPAASDGLEARWRKEKKKDDKMKRRRRRKEKQKRSGWESGRGREGEREHGQTKQAERKARRVLAGGSKTEETNEDERARIRR